MSVVYLEKSDVYATLSTWFYCCFWQLYAAEKSGHVGYVHWPQQHMRSLHPHQDPVAFARKPNMFDWYCEQPHWKGEGVPPRDLTWLWENCPETGTYCLMGQPIEVIRDYFQRNLIFNEEVRQRAQAIADKYAIDFDNTLALSWRGCDSTDDGRPRMPIQTYFPFIDEILNENPGLRIFATAEEQTIMDPVVSRYPGRVFMISEFFSAPLGYKLHSEYVNPVSGFERGMQTCCMISTLSKCKFYIKNRSSMAMVAAWLSNGHIVNLAHPETGAHGFDITKAEIKGVLCPLPVV